MKTGLALLLSLSQATPFTAAAQVNCSNPPLRGGGGADVAAWQRQYDYDMQESDRFATGYYFGGVAPQSAADYRRAAERDKACIEQLGGAASTNTGPLPARAAEAPVERVAPEPSRPATFGREALNSATTEARTADVDLYREVPLFLPAGLAEGRSLVADVPPDKLVVAPWAADQGDGQLVPGPVCVNLQGLCTQLAPGQEIPANAEVRLGQGARLDLVANGNPISVTARSEDTVIRQQELAREVTAPTARLLGLMDVPVEVARRETTVVTVEQGVADFAAVKAQGALTNLLLDVKSGSARLAEYADDAQGALKSVTSFLAGAKALVRGEQVALDAGTVVLGDGCGTGASCASGGARSVFGALWRTEPKGTGYSVSVETTDAGEMVVVAVARGAVTVYDEAAGSSSDVDAGTAIAMGAQAAAGAAPRGEVDYELIMLTASQLPAGSYKTYVDDVSNFPARADTPYALHGYSRAWSWSDAPPGVQQGLMSSVYRVDGADARVLYEARVSGRPNRESEVVSSPQATPLGDRSMVTASSGYDEISIYLVNGSHFIKHYETYGLRQATNDRGERERRVAQAVGRAKIMLTNLENALR